MEYVIKYNRMIFLVILLLFFIFMIYNSFRGFKKQRYCQQYYFYGFILLTIALLCEIMRYCLVELIGIIEKTAFTMAFFNIIISLIALLGGSIVLLGANKEKSKG